ncbi:MAG: hypothetical protein Q8R38_08550 [Candidatus Omnitrophota bacterium]|nr:hypothetical protein [Candidatus Omnitrophota bacterium]
MKKIIMLSVVVITISFLNFGAINAQDAWVAREGAVKNSEIKDAVFNKESLYIATKSALYRTKDVKQKWEPVFSLPQSGNNQITCVAGRSRAMFLGTRRGLFRSDDDGQRWINIFRTIMPDKNNITCIELSRHNRSRIIIATEKGVFASEDLGMRWQDISGALKNMSVSCLALNKEYMYAGTESGLHIRKADGGNWERIFVRSASERIETDEPQDTTEDEYETDASIKTIAIDGSRVYIGYSKEIKYSDDQGKAWKDLSREGLVGGINHILISAKNKRIYCATYKGVFEFDAEKSRWLELYKGIAKSTSVSRLIFGSDDENTIFAVTDNGLYSIQRGDYIMDDYPDIDKSLNTLKVIFDGEPTYKELQQAAIKYAEVSPEKIKKWRSEAKARALLPKVSLGADNSRSDTYDIYTSATKDYVVSGPDDTSDGWSVSVSWELGDLIWSDDQTNIDVRSRLMVQLRNDILDDLRRAYYERKRLQLELMANPYKDMNIRFEKELRLQELTHSIDDLTGNYLSDHIRKSSKSSKKSS